MWLAGRMLHRTATPCQEYQRKDVVADNHRFRLTQTCWRIIGLGIVATVRLSGNTSKLKWKCKNS